MAKKLIEYDDGESDADFVWDELTEICEDIMKNHKKVVKWGFFGTWNGAEPGGSIITDMKTLRGHICQDFSRPMSFSLEYADEGEVIEPMQRYCSSTKLEIPKGSLILKQWHHDGCNVYYIRGYVSGDHPETAKTEDIKVSE